MSATGPAGRSRGGRALEVGLNLYALVIFTVLWGGCLVGIGTGGALLEDAWTWLTGLDTVAAVVAWILLLPIAVGLWAWSEAGSVLVQGVVLVGLVSWTLLMARGVIRAFWRPAARG